MIKLSVNNETTEVTDATNLTTALQLWGYSEMKIAVAINGEFVPRSGYAECKLQTGDQIDIVKPVGGG